MVAPTNPELKLKGRKTVAERLMEPLTKRQKRKVLGLICVGIAPVIWWLGGLPFPTERSPLVIAMLGGLFVVYIMGYLFHVAFMEDD